MSVAPSVSQLTHETRETLERSRYPDAGVNLDENALGSVNVHLKKASLVQGRVEQRKETLVSNIRTRVGNVTAGLGQDTLVVVTVQKSVLRVLALGRRRVDLVRLETSL